MTKEISVREAHEAQQQGKAPLLLDVRTPGEFRAVHAEGAVNLPLSELTPEGVATLAAGRTVHVICKSGGRSAQACMLLAEKSAIELVNVAGGTDAWVSAGLPVVEGPGLIATLKAAFTW